MSKINSENKPKAYKGDFGSESSQAIIDTIWLVRGEIKRLRSSINTLTRKLEKEKVYGLKGRLDRIIRQNKLVIDILKFPFTPMEEMEEERKRIIEEIA